MNKKIFFITHTNIKTDVRIIRALNVALSSGLKVLGLGILNLGEPRLKESLLNLEVHNVMIDKKFVNIKFLRRIIYFFTINKIFYENINKSKPDLIYVNDWVVLLPSIKYKLKHNNVKIIYDAHELESETNGITLKLKKVVKYIEKRSWNNIDYLITVSNSIKEWYLDNYGYKNSSVILNSPDFYEKPIKKSTYLRDKFKIDTASSVYIYIGVLSRGRGLEMILDNFSKPSLINNHLVVIGFGELTKSFTEASEKYSNIHYHEPVEHKNLYEISSSADYGLALIENISLSDYYSIPNKILEYAFSNIKVIASNFPEMKKIIEKYDLGYTIDFSSENLHHLIKILENLKYVSNDNNLYDISWEAQAKKLSHVFKNLK